MHALDEETRSHRPYYGIGRSLLQAGTGSRTPTLVVKWKVLISNFLICKQFRNT